MPQTANIAVPVHVKGRRTSRYDPFQIGWPVRLCRLSFRLALAL